jgi:hypothetical protein
MRWTILLLTGCLGGKPTQTQGTDPTRSTKTVGAADSTASADEQSGGMTGSTFDHPNDGIDPFDLLERIQQQGTPEVTSRLHSCQKMKYATLGTVLTQLGIDLTNTATATSAAALYKNGGGALGQANYAGRIPETIALTTAGATKLFDIFVQAAPQIIAAMPTAKSCMRAGAPTQMFDAAGKCNKDGITCLKGAPATDDEKALCDQVIGEASSTQIGQTIAVATILSSAQTCE